MIRKLKSGQYRLYSRKPDPHTRRPSPSMMLSMRKRSPLERPARSIRQKGPVISD
jgi:hypothetical protein